MGQRKKATNCNIEASLHDWRDLFSPCVVILGRQVVARALSESRTLKRLNLADNDIGTVKPLMRKYPETYIGIRGVQARRSHWVAGVCRGIAREVVFVQLL